MKTEYCADAIATYQGKIVLVERLNFPQGYAIPGGRRDYIDNRIEDVYTCAVREFKEETGLDLIIKKELGTYDAPNRDPRGPKISTVVVGSAYGKIRDEIGKTRVFLFDPTELDKYKECFAFDHYKILQDWMGGSK